MHAIHGPLPDADRATAGEALQGALVDLVGLSLVGKQLPWNVVGRRFRSVHLQLDEIVALARQHADTVAALVAALGAVIARTRQRITATAGPDPVSQDVLIGLTADLEKYSWMAQAEHTG